MKEKIDRTIFVSHKSSLLPCVYEYALSYTHRKIINYLLRFPGMMSVTTKYRIYIYVYNVYNTHYFHAKPIVYLPNKFGRQSFILFDVCSTIIILYRYRVKSYIRRYIVIDTMGFKWLS